jgi:hypothetical protein
MSSRNFPPFRVIVADARAESGLTAAEFDYSLQSADDFRADQALGNAIYRATGARATIDHPYADDVDIMRTAARAKSYTGWSVAGRGPIRYATKA